MVGPKGSKWPCQGGWQVFSQSSDIFRFALHSCDCKPLSVELQPGELTIAVPHTPTPSVSVRPLFPINSFNPHSNPLR